MKFPIFLFLCLRSLKIPLRLSGKLALTDQQLSGIFQRADKREDHCHAEVFFNRGVE
jgi:hypothetical protein